MVAITRRPRPAVRRNPSRRWNHEMNRVPVGRGVGEGFLHVPTTGVARHMKTTLSSLLVLAGVFLSQAIVPQSLAAQSSTLSGTVVDAQTLQPLGAVQVMIPSLGVGALSQ